MQHHVHQSTRLQYNWNLSASVHKLEVGHRDCPQHWLQAVHRRIVARARAAIEDWSLDTDYQSNGPCSKNIIFHESNYLQEHIGRRSKIETCNTTIECIKNWENIQIQCNNTEKYDIYHIQQNMNTEYPQHSFLMSLCIFLCPSAGSVGRDKNLNTKKLL